MIKKCCGNDVAALAKFSHTTYVRTATNGNVSSASKFREELLYRNHILALIFVDL